MAGSPKGKANDDEANERLREIARELLKASGNKQKVLAAQLGVAQPTVSNFVKGKTGAGIQLAFALAKNAGVNLMAVIDPAWASNDAGPRWRTLPWWADTIAKARKRFPKVTDLAWTKLGNLMGERPPAQDDIVLGMMASAWDQAATDDARGAAIDENADREMAEEDQQMELLLRQREEARAKGLPLPPLPDDPPPPPRPKGRSDSEPPKVEAVKVEGPTKPGKKPGSRVKRGE